MKIGKDTPTTYFLLHWTLQNRVQVHGEDEKHSKEFFDMMEKNECVPIIEEILMDLFLCSFVA